MKRRPKILLSTVLSAAWLFASGPLWSQNSNLFFDTIDVNVVNIEVVVTDEDGQPVTDLTREDFAVFEDGEPVELTNFFPVVKRQATFEPMATTGGQPVSEPETTKQLQLVVFVDNVNIDPRHRNAIFSHLKQFLGEEFDPSGQVMLASLNDTVEIEQPFTNDIGALMSALERMENDLGRAHPLRTEMFRFMNDLQRAELVDEGQATSFNAATVGTSVGGSDGKATDFRQTVITADRLGQTAKQLAERRYALVKATIDALGQFTDSLAGLPGRKALLYISDGLHVRPAEALSQAFWDKYQGWIQLNGSSTEVREVERTGLQLESLKLDATRDFQALVEYASANRVAFYPLSNLGQTADSYVSAEVMGSNSSTGSGPFSAVYASLDTMSRESSLVHMADGTGGKAFTRSSNLGLLMATLEQDFSNFYSLGYNSPHPSDDDRFHKIKVEVKRPGVKVRHSSGHLAKDPLDHLETLTLSAARHQLVDNPLEVQLVTSGEQTLVAGKKKRYEVPLTVQIPFGKLLLLPEEEYHTGRVSLFVVVLDPESGGLSKPQHIELPIQVPNERIFDALTQAVGYPLTLQLERGPKRIAIGVRDNLARLDATLQLELEVGESG